MNNNSGLKVSLIYEERGQNSKAFECILSTFEISMQNILVLQRRKSTKSTIELGEATFNIFEFVNLINELISKTAKP